LVVFGRSNHDPWIVLVPVKVADTVGEAAVHEQPGNMLVDEACSKKMCLQLWRSVLSLLLRLLVANLAQIPHANAAIIAGAGEDRGILRMPLQTDNISAVALQTVQLLLKVSQVPGGDCLVSRASSQEGLELGMEGDAVDGILVCLFLVECLLVSLHTGVDDLPGEIVGRGTDEKVVDGVVLYVALCIVYVAVGLTVLLPLEKPVLMSHVLTVVSSLPVAR
jgi:hypothetical protein